MMKMDRNPKDLSLNYDEGAVNQSGTFYTMEEIEEQFLGEGEVYVDTTPEYQHITTDLLMGLAEQEVDLLALDEEDGDSGIDPTD